VIAARRARGDAERDFLQTMIDFRYKDKEGNELRGYTDDEIVGMLIVLLFAGQHTSSISVTWLGAMLLSHPEALEEVMDEQRHVFEDGTAPLSYEKLIQLDAMRRAISETLRLYPPLILLMRKARSPARRPLLRAPTQTARRALPPGRW